MTPGSRTGATRRPTVTARSHTTGHWGRREPAHTVSRSPDRLTPRASGDDEPAAAVGRLRRRLARAPRGGCGLASISSRMSRTSSTDFRAGSSSPQSRYRSPGKMGHASPHPIVTTTSAASTTSAVSGWGTSLERWSPASSIAAITTGLISPAGVLPPTGRVRDPGRDGLTAPPSDCGRRCGRTQTGLEHFLHELTSCLCDRARNALGPTSRRAPNVRLDSCVLPSSCRVTQRGLRDCSARTHPRTPAEAVLPRSPAPCVSLVEGRRQATERDKNVNSVRPRHFPGNLLVSTRCE